MMPLSHVVYDIGRNSQMSPLRVSAFKLVLPNDILLYHGLSRKSERTSNRRQ